MKTATLHISSGQGPKECQWFAEQLVGVFAREAASSGLYCALSDRAESGGSFLITIEGEHTDAFVDERVGTIGWIGTSPYRPNHKRKNWFVGVTKLREPEDMPDFDPRDIVYQSLRASGPGGQHVNKTDSAVRATHTPTGLSCVCQDQRSQFANKKTAQLRIALMLEEREVAQARQSDAAMWSENQSVERGNAVRTYEGRRFKRKE